jgi:dUTPase
MSEIPVFKFCVLQCPTTKRYLDDFLEHGETFLPTKAYPKATGWDVRSACDVVIPPGSFFKIPLGIKAFPPPGWWFQLHPRSSMFFKKHCNCLVGIIDETFPLEVALVGQYHGKETLVINLGDRVGQIIPIKRQDMVISHVSADEFDKLVEGRSAVRTGGIGSTG